MTTTHTTIKEAKKLLKSSESWKDCDVIAVAEHQATYIGNDKGYPEYKEGKRRLTIVITEKGFEQPK